MNKLLNFEFRNAFKMLYVRLMPFILLAFGLLCGYMNTSTMEEELLEYCQMDELPQLMTVLSWIVTLIGGLLICKDYTQNTIRNKIIVGHSRTKIYLAKQVVVTAIYLLNAAVFYIGYTVSNILIVGTAHLNKNGLARVTVCIFVSYLMLSLFACFLSMTVKGTLGGALPMLAVYGTLFISALREMMQSKFLEYASDIIPMGSLMSSSVSDPYPHLLRSCILMTCFSVACLCTGIAIFRRTNLN